MADQRDGGIAWTDTTWNPTRGCSRVSPGCVNCYAERQAARFSGPGQPYEGLVRMHVTRYDDGAGVEPVAREPRWTGVVRLVPEHLADPLRWRRPRRVFVNSMSDLFHESLSDEDIAAVFGVMAAAPQHTFQILTKRAERMRRWFAWYEGTSGAGASAYAAVMEARGRFVTEGDDGALFTKVPVPESGAWPLPNVWLGVSVEDQQRADERIPELLATPAAVRWVSYEPALAAVNFHPWLCAHGDVAKPEQRMGHFCDPSGALDWIVVGGESGPGARPFELAWARSTIRQCREAGVACFVKQLGARPVDARIENGRVVLYPQGRSKYADPAEWPEDLRRREFPNVQR